jgi:glycosyltransferase involved in cell wall biosynthesis
MIVSIITVVLNNKETVKDAILSVGSQDYNEIEHIVIDGKSVDGTQTVIDKYSDRLAVVISERDNGIYDAMNKGLRLASGEIIGFLNSDDLYASNNVISDVVSVLLKMKVDAVFGDLVFVSSKDLNHFVRYYQSKNFSPKLLAKGIMPAHPTLFLRKTVYEKYGYFKTDYRIAADFEFAVRIFKDYNISYYYIPKIMVKMRTGGTSTKNLKSNWILNLEVLRACRENGLKTNLFKIYSKYPSKILGLIKRERINKSCNFLQP